ncbi:MAG: HAD family hydrolase [Pseudomonadales bacterium]
MTEPGGITAVLFDLGGVLFHYEPEVRWQALAEVTGLTATDVQKRLSVSGWAQACDQGRYRGARAFDAGVRSLGHRLSRERFTHLWVSAFRPDERVLDIAVRLKAHVQVALFTNNSDLVREGLENLWGAVLAPFMPRIYSADLGLTKPDPRAYLKAAELLGAPPERILVIDDSPANTASAASLGFPCIDYRDPEDLLRALATCGLS